jgi:hypothetical protein
LRLSRRHAWADWQLQHRCVLPFGQLGHQHNLSIRQLKSIMMDAGSVLVDLAESGNLVRKERRLRFPSFRVLWDCYSDALAASLA